MRLGTDMFRGLVFTDVSHYDRAWNRSCEPFRVPPSL